MLTRSIYILLLNLFCSSFLFSQVRFSSEFESGSLGGVKLLDSSWLSISSKDSILLLSYDVISRHDPLNPVDTSLQPSARWYFFRMEGIKGKLVFLNIQNSEAIRPFYSYDGVNFQRFEQSENTLKGSVNKIFSRDTVYISHFIPYTYSRLRDKIDKWSESEFVINQEIGRSQMNLPIYMLTITDSTVSDRNKKRIWIHGRAHPSEQPCSWHLEAMIDELTSGSDYSKALLANAVFYIVPFINPDGVAGGYSRSSSTGINLEVNWDRPDSLTTPEVKALKKKLIELTSENPLDLFLNMHSQIAGSVTYWIHTAESTSDRTYRNQLLLSNLTINNTPYFLSKDQSFSGVAPRYAEGWMWSRFGDRTPSITFETPYTYYNENESGEWVSIENLKKLGLSSLNAISDYLSISSSCRVLTDPLPLNKKRWERVTDEKSVYFGEDYLKSIHKGAGIKISITDLEKGDYKIYGWRVGPADKISPSGENIWKEIGYVKHKKNGKLVWRTKGYKPGDCSDKILLVK